MLLLDELAASSALWERRVAVIVWAPREAGERVSRETLLGLLDERAARVPRTTLSYAADPLDPEASAAYRRMS